MTAHIYGRGQMVIPSKARKEAGINGGDVVLVEANGDGRILLIRLERPKTRKPANARLIRRKGRHSVIAGAPKVNPQQISRILRDEFP
jgi:AbrB family looped-hinge helix DNA binding protein